jgi:hypothetical protein
MTPMQPNAIETPEQVWQHICGDFELRLPLIVSAMTEQFEHDSDERSPEEYRQDNGDNRLKAIVEIEMDYTAKTAEMFYQACCEIWEIQDRQKSKTFFQAISKYCLLPFFKQQRQAVCRQLKQKNSQEIGPGKRDAAIGRYADYLASLKFKWKNRFSIEERNSEYAKRRDLDSSQHARVEKDLRILKTAEYDDGSRAHKPGPKGRLEEKFVEFAGRLWKEGQSTKGRVSNQKLLEIASSLDKERYTPPKDYLEKKVAEELRDFNSKNARTASGPITCWKLLVTNKDKDLIAGMRKLLSRCAGHIPN